MVPEVVASDRRLSIRLQYHFRQSDLEHTGASFTCCEQVNTLTHILVMLSILEKAGVVQRPATGFDIEKFANRQIARLVE